VERDAVELDPFGRWVEQAGFARTLAGVHDASLWRVVGRRRLVGAGRLLEPVAAPMSPALRTWGKVPVAGDIADATSAADGWPPITGHGGHW